MVITKTTLTTKQVLEIIPFINQIGLDNLSSSGRVKRKKVGKLYQYDKKSVNIFLHSFNTDDYKTVSQTTEILNDYGIKDTFKYFGSKHDNRKKKCKYIRFTKEFPMSVKNLITYDYLEIDTDIKPTLIKSESIVSTLKHYKQVMETPMKPINNTLSVENKLIHFLNKVG